MKILKKLDDILKEFSSVFRREATFGWFVTVLMAFLLRTDVAGVTSFVRVMNLSPNEYYNILNFFYSTAFTVFDLCRCWLCILLERAPVVKLRGKPVFIADDVKVAKEGDRMPAVKVHNQQSGNSSKADYIMGHFWGALGLLARCGKTLFCIPVILKIHDGYWTSPVNKTTTVEKMSYMASILLPIPSYLIADAAFTTKEFLKYLVECGCHYIGRIRSTTVAYMGYEPLSEKRSRGRKRKKPRKEEVKLEKLFSERHLFRKASVELYKDIKDVLFYPIDLFWFDMEHLVRFVLTIYPDGKESILVSTDTSLTPEEIIIAYGWRYRIESSFKFLVHLVCGLAYHFWLKGMEKIKIGSKGQYLHRADEEYRARFLGKIEAYERFANIAAISLGILQLLSLRMGSYIWKHFPLWLRTFAKDECPSEMVVRVTLQHELYRNFVKSRPHLLFSKILRRKGALKNSPSIKYGMAA